MRKLKVIAAEIVRGRSCWIAITFEGYHRQLCVNATNGRGLYLLDTLFDRPDRISGLVGQEVLAAELPRRSNYFACWEKIELPATAWQPAKGKRLHDMSP